MRVGIQKYLAAGTVVLPGGPVSYPATPSQFTALTGITLDALYVNDEASGTVVDRVAGTDNLATVAGTRVYQYPNFGKTGILFNSSAASVNKAGDVNAPALQSAIIGAVATVVTTFGASLPGIIGYIDGDAFPAFALYRASDAVNYPVFLMRDAAAGSTFLADAAANVVSPRRPFLILGQIDRTANIGYLGVYDGSRRIVTSSASTAAVGSITGGASSPMFHQGAGVANAGGNAVSLGFYAVGAQCEGATLLDTIAKRLGWL